MFCSIKFSKHKGENIYDIRLPINLKDKNFKKVIIILNIEKKILY